MNDRITQPTDHHNALVDLAASDDLRRTLARNDAESSQLAAELAALDKQLADLDAAIDDAHGAAAQARASDDERVLAEALAGASVLDLDAPTGPDVAHLERRRKLLASARIERASKLERVRGFRADSTFRKPLAEAIAQRARRELERLGLATMVSHVADLARVTAYLDPEAPSLDLGGGVSLVRHGKMGLALIVAEARPEGRDGFADERSIVDRWLGDLLREGVARIEHDGRG